MRWYSIFFVFALLFFTVISISVFAEITGDTVTGKATANQVGLNITVTSTAKPTLTIITPENKTYLTNASIPLNYTVSNEHAVWYSLDNANNITITSTSFYFNTSQGNHTLWLYANNSYGLTTRNVSFIANLTKFIITNSEFNSTTKGNSTNFLFYTYDDIENISDAVIENTNFGQILFNEVINLTDDATPNDGDIDIDTYINISDNSITIDTTNLPNFNKSATLYLYNLTFADPQILRDGSECSSTICTEEDYTGGTLKFNVTEFTTYSARQTPAGLSPPGGGTGGTGGATTTTDFSISKDKIKVSLKQGETKKEEVIINNKGDSKLEITLEQSGLEDILETDETSFYLTMGQSKTITLEFSAKEDSIPDLYSGKLIIKIGGIEKKILISTELESKKSLLDVKLEIPQKFLRVAPGEYIMANIDLYNIRISEKVDIYIKYTIKDTEDNIIASEEETIALEKEKSFVKSIEVLDDAKYGDYIFYIKATYNGEVAIASHWFTVGKKPFWSIENILLITTIFIILTLVLILYELKRIKKRMRIGSHILLKEKLIK